MHFMLLTRQIQKATHLLRITCLFLLIVVSGLMLASTSIKDAHAHPEDEFCEVGSGIDPALCRKLAEIDSATNDVVSPLLDNEGNARSWFDTAILYMKIGVQHILPGGLDHILFVLALFLASERMRSLIIQISAFTAAHTITLAFAASGVINPPSSIVEPLIALSIAFVAIENLFFKDMPKWRPLVVFGFGLFHGLGFAGFIRNVGLPPEQFWSSLIGFNLGVELGQLTVVIVAVILCAPLKPALVLRGYSYRSIIVMPISILIAVIGLWWAITRALGL